MSDGTFHTEERLKRIVKGSRDGLWDWNLDTNECYMTEQAYQLLDISHTAEPITFDAIVNRLLPEDQPETIEAMRDLIENDVEYDVEHRIFLADGTVRYCLCRGRTTDYQADGSPSKISGTVTDVTRLKQAELALGEKEAQFRTLANSIPQIAWMADATGYIFWYNQRFYELFDEPFEAVQGWGWTKLLHPDYGEGVVSRLKEAIEQGTPWEDTFPVRVKDGPYRWFLSRAMPIRDFQGRTTRWFGTNTDVTLLREAEQALRDNEEQLKRVLEGSNDGVWDWNLKTGKLYWNNRFYEILGLEPQSVEPDFQRVLDCMTEPEQEKMQAAIGRHLETGASYQMEYHLRTATGDYRVCLCRGKVTERDAQDKPVWFSGTLTDITYLKEIEATMQSAQARLEQSNRDLEQFTVIASHDLKAPLRKVTTFLEMIQKDNGETLTENSQDLMARAVQSLGSMQAMIDGLLTLSRLSSQTISVERVTLSEIMVQVLQNLEEVIRTTGAQVVVGHSEILLADPPQLVQLLQNLVENGIKYQPAGQQPHIFVDSRCLDGRYCEIQVKDNGIGIKPDAVSRIFKPFERLHGKTSPYAGTGIGLSICQRIVERHLGTISVKSQPGEGACFIIRLPLPVMEPSQLIHLM